MYKYSRKTPTKKTKKQTKQKNKQNKPPFLFWMDGRMGRIKKKVLCFCLFVFVGFFSFLLEFFVGFFLFCWSSHNKLYGFMIEYKG
jgi:hypothetical protein